MAGAVLERELTIPRKSGVEFYIATQSDDAEIRRLLRQNPMAGRISLTLEREPNYFADATIGGATKQTILARNAGRVVCVGQCTLQKRFVNGTARQVGYLGGLRLDASWGGRFDIVRRGYAFFHELQAKEPADFYFTSIAADNQRARRLLEANIRGLPTYEFAGEYVTLVVSTHERPHSRIAQTDLPSPAGDSAASAEWISFLNAGNAEYQFSPFWDRPQLVALKALGLSQTYFRTVTKHGQWLAGGALWDQRSFKQTVVRSYAPPLAWMRPLLNATTPIHGQPKLPRVGSTLAAAVVSHLAVRENNMTALFDVIHQLRFQARQRGIAMIILGFAANDPRLALVRRSFRCREYHSRIYVVRWPHIGAGARDLENRILNPEVALL